MQKSIIVAMSRNRVIGSNNQIPWHMPSDMRYFRKRTLGHPIIMGRKTFDSIGKPLPKRTNIVLTRQKSLYFPPGTLVSHDILDALRKATETGAEEAFIIGGSKIYAEALPLSDNLYITEIHGDIKGDIYFPPFELNAWQEVDRKMHMADRTHLYNYDFVKYIRRKEGFIHLHVNR